MGAVSSGLDNDDLVDNLMKANYISTTAIERVFRSVDRAAYYLPEYKYNAYKDLAWKRGNIHLSAPCIYSVVMEHLNLTPGLSFLNVGSGTGYLSTLVGLLLGPFGINHGVELYPDVIQYALEKLHDFKNNSPAADIFEFCEPLFVKGNGLSLPRDTQYDRIYCGAACPDRFINYMKSLLKVGGVLVVPVQEELLQILRVSNNEWQQKSVLNVSFATLQLPDDDNLTVVLPDPKPISLKALSRCAIRQILRSIAEREHPELIKIRARRFPRRKRKSYHTLYIPLFDPTGRDVSRSSGAIECYREVIQARLPPRLQHYFLSSSSSEDEPSNGVEPQSTIISNTAPVSKFRKSKREKFDSGIVDDMETIKEDEISLDEDLDDSMICQEYPQNETSLHTDSDPSVMAKPEENADEGVEDLCNQPGGSTETASAGKEDRLPSYGFVMQKKIKALPLPRILKVYVNLDREL